MYTIILLFIIGLMVGSFLNSVIYRLDDLKSIIREKSHCPKCKTPIRWYDLVPLLSFVVLTGQCRNCKGKISWQYPIVELATAVLFVLLYLQFGLTLYTLFLILASCFLIVVFVYDFHHQLIPDEMIWGAIGLWFIYLIYSFIIHNSPFIILNYIYGGLIAAGVIAFIVLTTRGKGMGFGDIKLALLLGLILGFPNAIVGVVLAFIIGAIVGLGLVIGKIKKMSQTIAFGPFLIIGFYLALFWGDKILNWYLK